MSLGLLDLFLFIPHSPPHLDNAQLLSFKNLDQLMFFCPLLNLKQKQFTS